jgi:phosphoglycerol transferase
LWLVLLLIGLADHSLALRDVARNAKSTEAGFRDLERYVSTLEATLPPRSAVFQLPIRPYPVDEGVERMGVYEHFGPYVVSRDLRWSYPAISREQYDWERTISQLPVSALPRALAQQGFSAILLNRSGYGDEGGAMERALRDAAGGGPVLAENRDLVAIDLRHLPTSAPAKDTNR